MIADERAEKALLGAYCQSKIETLPLDLLSGQLKVVAAVVAQKGRPSSPNVLSLWANEVGLVWTNEDSQEIFGIETGDPVQLVDGLTILATRRRLGEAAQSLQRLSELGNDNLAVEASKQVAWALELTSGVSTKGYEAALQRLHGLVAGQRAAEGWKLSWSPLFSEAVGPLGPDIMMVLSGKPSSGKTVWTMQLALDFAQQGAPVLYVSQDMGVVRGAVRALSLLARVPYRDIWRNETSVIQGWKAQHALERLEKLPLKIISMTDIYEVCRAAQEMKAKVLIYDYAQKIRVPGMKGGDVISAQTLTTAAHVLDDFKDKCFVCLVSQRQRGADDSDASSTKWSSALNEVADVSAVLKRDWETNLTTLVVGKSRDGPDNIEIPYYFLGPLMQLIELNEAPVGIALGGARE